MTKFEKEGCNDFHSKILGDRLLGSTPYFYPFIVEFALIGASVAYIMSNHIGKRYLHLILQLVIEFIQRHNILVPWHLELVLFIFVCSHWKEIFL